MADQVLPSAEQAEELTQVTVEQIADFLIEQTTWRANVDAARQVVVEEKAEAERKIAEAEETRKTSIESAASMCIALVARMASTAINKETPDQGLTQMLSAQMQVFQTANQEYEKKVKSINSEKNSSITDRIAYLFRNVFVELNQALI